MLEGCASPHPGDPMIVCELIEGHPGSHAALTWVQTSEPVAAGAWQQSTELCVSCPECAFTFGAGHVTQATGEYDCPVCAESRLRSDREAMETGLRDAGPDPVALRSMAESIVASWNALGRCEDEFNPDAAPYCGEYAEHLDSAISAMAGWLERNPRALGSSREGQE